MTGLRVSQYSFQIFKKNYKKNYLDKELCLNNNIDTFM